MGVKSIIRDLRIRRENVLQRIGKLQTELRSVDTALKAMGKVGGGHSTSADISDPVNNMPIVEDAIILRERIMRLLRDARGRLISRASIAIQLSDDPVRVYQQLRVLQDLAVVTSAPGRDGGYKLSDTGATATAAVIGRV